MKVAITLPTIIKASGNAKPPAAVFMSTLPTTTVPLTHTSEAIRWCEFVHAIGVMTPPADRHVIHPQIPMATKKICSAASQ
jgi:hypothetical protein